MDGPLCGTEFFFGSADDTPSYAAKARHLPDLLKRAKNAKGATMKRVIKSLCTSMQTKWEAKEIERRKITEKNPKQMDCMTSQMNMCQVLMKANCAKPVANKGQN